MNIQRKNSAHHFRMQSEREQTLGLGSTCSNQRARLLHIGEGWAWPGLFI